MAGAAREARLLDLDHLEDPRVEQLAVHQVGLEYHRATPLRGAASERGTEKEETEGQKYAHKERQNTIGDRNLNSEGTIH